jgi:hypothetical protein
MQPFLARKMSAALAEQKNTDFGFKFPISLRTYLCGVTAYFRNAVHTSRDTIGPFEHLSRELEVNEG